LAFKKLTLIFNKVVQKENRTGQKSTGRARPRNWVA